MAAEDLIISTATGYGPEDLRIFLRSAAEHVPRAEVLLITEREDRAFRDRLAEFHPRVRLWRPPDAELRPRMWRSSRRVRRIRSFSRIQSLRRQAALWSPRPAYGLAAFHAVISRHFYVLSILKNNGDGGARRILLADSRDVFFQDDPFEGCGDMLTVSEEARTFAPDSHPVQYLRRVYSPQVAARITERPVLCAGVILGCRRAILELEEAMVREIRKTARHVFGRFMDQILFNKVLYADGQLDFRALPEGNPLMTHLICVPREFFGLDADGLKNDAGERIRIVHRYDRHAELADHAARRWGVPNDGTESIPAKPTPLPCRIPLPSSLSLPLPEAGSGLEPGPEPVR